MRRVSHANNTALSKALAKRGISDDRKPLGGSYGMQRGNSFNGTRAPKPRMQAIDEAKYKALHDNTDIDFIMQNNNVSQGRIGLRPNSGRRYLPQLDPLLNKSAN